ncbi:carbohydrate kinase family protein [Candidatus Auribacterota bacterium]
MSKNKIQVLGLGQCSLDYLGKVPLYPPPDIKCEFKGLTIQGGGPVATALVALSRWGISCSFMGVVGDDYFGESIKTALTGEGIDTKGLLVRQGYSSQFAFIVAEPKIARRTIFWQQPTGKPIQPEKIDESFFTGVNLFHTDGLFTEASIAAAKMAQKKGIPVMVDAGSMREGMLELAMHSDYFITSKIFAQALIQKDDFVGVCHKLASLGPKVVGVTLGEKGYVALSGDQLIKGPAYEVDAVDTTGCGDVFHAGVVYGVLSGWKIEKSLRFAAWSAAQVSLHLGGRTGIPKACDFPE